MGAAASKQVEIATAAAMERLGGCLAAAIESPCIIYLNGDLGAGKTTLVRGLVQALGHSDNVKSPTYTLVEPYDFDDKTVYHFDLYRVQSPQELLEIGIEEYFTAKSIALIEWPENGAAILPTPDLTINIAIAQNNIRFVELISDNSAIFAILENINRS